MFWLTLAKDIIKILRAGENPGQVAGGFALGTLLGPYQTPVDANLALVGSKKKELDEQLEKVKAGAVDGLMRGLLKK